jgi:hypothetical protein
MPEFLTQGLTQPELTDGLTVIARLLFAMLLGGSVAWIYRRTSATPDFAPSFPVTLVLLAILIAMVTQVIGDNVARAFSLVGALSIVRFRTVVRDTRDTAFVIFAVVTGMAAGANNIWVALTGLVVVGIAAYVMNRRASVLEADPRAYELNLRMALGSDVDALLKPLFADHLISNRLLAIGTARQGISLNVSYETQLRPATSPNDLVKALNRIEGVQGVELRRSVTTED